MASSISALSLAPGPTRQAIPNDNCIQEGGPHPWNVAFTDAFVQVPDPTSWPWLSASCIWPVQQPNHFR
uniref:Uncharacterized protein n=1 Tax=Oryza punctata TaxID=4537 RepID=A0A0E0MIM7_ORYPU